jgi:kojibiose phosphorylase
MKMIKIKDFEIIQDSFLAAENKIYEGVFAQGNGFFHVRGSFEEGFETAPQGEEYIRTMKSVTTEIQRHPLSKYGTFMPLIMGEHPHLGEVIINLPYFMGIDLYADGEKLDLINSDIKDFSRVLNMRTGELKRRLIWLTKQGAEIEVLFKRFASAADVRLFVQQVQCTVLSGNAKVEMVSETDPQVTTNGHKHFKKIELQSDVAKQTCTVETDLGYVVTIISEEDRFKDNELSLTKYTVLGCSREQVEDYNAEMNTSMLQAKEKGYERLLNDNNVIWEKKWSVADVKIKGLAELQNGLRFSIYHLLRCSNGSSEQHQICAKGFAGEAYYGRYFWDSEMYLLPFYAYTDPQSARSMIMYRYHMLEGARANADKYHCQGARYPWQSGITGTEQCSLWEYGDNEIHITADVAFGVMHYFKATNDFDFMKQYGIKILIETAIYWTNRIDYDSEGKCHLLNVMGPDEYSPMTKDNGFTNRMVKYNLQSALAMLQLLKEMDLDCYHVVVKKYELDNQMLELFERIAKELPIPYDETRDLYLQSADFEEYAAIDLDDFWEDKNKAFGHFVTQEKIYRTRCIKQADTIALMNLFDDEFTDEQVKNAYTYYQPFTTHDSSLSPAIHTLAAHRIGAVDDVAEFVSKTLSVDLSIDKKGTEDGIHIANCGALWQALVFGFAGIKPAYLSDKLEVKGTLPAFIEEMEFHVYWKNEQYYIKLSHKDVLVQKVEG